MTAVDQDQKSLQTKVQKAERAYRAFRDALAALAQERLAYYNELRTSIDTKKIEEILKKLKTT